MKPRRTRRFAPLRSKLSQTRPKRSQTPENNLIQESGKKTREQFYFKAAQNPRNLSGKTRHCWTPFALSDVHSLLQRHHSSPIRARCSEATHCVCDRHLCGSYLQIPAHRGFDRGIAPHPFHGMVHGMTQAALAATRHPADWFHDRGSPERPVQWDTI